MLPDRRSERRKGIALRFENAFALQQSLSIGRTNMQRAVAASNALGTSGQQRLFVAAPRGNRRRTSAKTSRCSVRELIVFSGRVFHIPIPAISSCGSLLYRCLQRARN